MPVPPADSEQRSVNWWKNCGTADVETRELDAMESTLAPLPDHVRDTRALIGTIECCHHKAERWINLIVDAIGTGKPAGGLGTRRPGQLHPREEAWAAACEELNAWLAGRSEAVRPRVLDALGARDDLKAWQVARIEHRIRSHVGWPAADDYVFLVEPLTEDLASSVCPDPYSEDEAFWRRTVDTLLHDSSGEYLDDGGYVDSKGYIGATSISLAVAIDMLWPCNWNFDDNLVTVLEAIGGNTSLSRPFAACAWNIRKTPIRPRMAKLCGVLDAYGRGEFDADSPVHQRLGSRSAEKAWLSRSLAKTIRLQLYVSS